jgi:hypothetical protein
MSISQYYRVQAQKCLALSQRCADRQGAAQLALMANRYFERAEELEQGVRFRSTPPTHCDEARIA